jgi:hypothetical protein
MIGQWLPSFNRLTMLASDPFWLAYCSLYGSVSKPIVPLVNPKIAGKWMFIPLKMLLIGIDP